MITAPAGIKWVRQGSPEYEAQWQNGGESGNAWNPYANMYAVNDPQVIRASGFGGPATVWNPGDGAGEASSGGEDINPEFQGWMRQNGVEPVTAFGGDGYAYTALMKDGQIIEGTVRKHEQRDRQFQLGALAAMGITGLNLLAAGAAGGGAGAAAGGAAEGAGALGGTLDGSLAALEATGGTGIGLGGGAAAEGAGALTAAAGSADKAALLTGSGYGSGMTGAQTSVFDAVSSLTGSNSLAATAANAATGSIGEALGSGWDWLKGSLGGGIPGGSSLFGNGWLRDVLGLVGAGVQQMNIEKMAQDQRDWQDERDAASRRRRMPTSALAAARFTVNGSPVNGG